MSEVLQTAVRWGLERAGLEVSTSTEIGVVTYLELLSKWNRKINLTAFDLGSAPESAIDRLVVEPLVAARAILPTHRVAIDIGSGGGSPALPLLLACPWLRMTLVEVRQRKASFLREAIRVLGVAGTVEVGLFEDVSGRLADQSADVVSMRAVRPGKRLVGGIARLLADRGVMLWFGDVGLMTQSLDLESSLSSEVHVLQRRR